jgi:hypothetical protein
LIPRLSCLFQARDICCLSQIQDSWWLNVNCCCSEQRGMFTGFARHFFSWSQAMELAEMWCVTLQNTMRTAELFKWEGVHWKSWCVECLSYLVNAMDQWVTQLLLPIILKPVGFNRWPRLSNPGTISGCATQFMRGCCLLSRTRCLGVCQNVSRQGCCLLLRKMCLGVAECQQNGLLQPRKRCLGVC